MTDLIIQAENLSKRYQIGKSRASSIKEATEEWWRKIRNQKAESDTKENLFWALQDVSFSIQRGEVVGVIGRNGAGKSTLLKILSKITEPTSGRAVMRGRVASLLEVGTGFHPDLTGRENVYLNGAILGMRKNEIIKKFDEIVTFAEVEKFIDTPVKHYSSGMYVRLAFAVAAHLDPEILLVDEVLAVGDAAFQKKCLGKMDDLSKNEARTVLFVNHNMGQIRRLCHRALWIDGGTCRKFGSAETVIAEYEKSITKISSTEVESSRDNGFLGWSIEGQETQIIRKEGPFAIRIKLRLDRAVKGVHHGLVLKNLEDQNVAGWQFELNLEAGEHDLIYSFPALPLRPGSYYWYVSAWEGARKIDVRTLLPELILAVPEHSRLNQEWSGILNIPCHMENS